MPFGESEKGWSVPSEEIREGSTKIIVPKVRATGGPLTSKTPIFYNPIMEFNRDVSVLLVSKLIEEGGKEILDGLAGTGIRGVRFANEIEKGASVTINDWNPIAHKFIKKNIEMNKLKNAVYSGEDLNVLLSRDRGRYDYIDIDPFGSPIMFFDSAVRSIKGNGVVGVTATDTAPLCGTYPKTCLRRYGSHSSRTSYMHETGARILIASFAKTAMKYDYNVIPILVHSTDHYFRFYARVKKRTTKAKLSINNIGYAAHDFKTGRREIFTEAEFFNTSKKYKKLLENNEKMGIIGPLWIGELFDIEIVKKLPVKKQLGTIKRVQKMQRLWIEEANATPLFYDMNEIASILKVSPPRLEEIIEKLKECGFDAWRTHFSPTGFKTTAKIEDINDTFRSLAKSK
ncbi:MAG: tRNA (guanine(10)-N(2))-dimethyltransferase [Thermoplasmata archaeon]